MQASVVVVGTGNKPPVTPKAKLNAIPSGVAPLFNTVINGATIFACSGRVTRRCIQLSFESSTEDDEEEEEEEEEEELLALLSTSNVGGGWTDGDELFVDDALLLF